MTLAGVREEVSEGGIVVRHDAGIPHVLLILDRYRNWGFPKGHVEANEVSSDAERLLAHENARDVLTRARERLAVLAPADAAR